MTGRNTLGPTLGMTMSMQQTQRLEPRLEPRLRFDQQHPLIELMAIYERSKPMTLSITNRKTGQTVDIEYVMAPHKVMDYVKEGEPFGISMAGKIFVSDRTPLEYAPVVAFKLFEEAFIDPGLDTTGRVKHLKAAIDSVKFAAFMDLPPHAIKMFAETLVAHDPSGIIETDETIKHFMNMPSWKHPEKAKYLENHNAHWRVRHSRVMAGFLQNLGSIQQHFRDFGIAKGDLVLSRTSHINPYLLGNFIRSASTIPIGKPFVIDAAMSAPAYALTEEICGVDLIRFVPQKPPVVGVNEVYRSRNPHGIEATWQSLVTRVEFGLLMLEGKTDEKIRMLREDATKLSAELDEKTANVSKAIARVTEDPSMETLAEVISMSEASNVAIGAAAASLNVLKQRLAVFDSLKRAISG